MGVADVDALAELNRAQDVGNEPVFCPIAAANDVARTSACQRNRVFAMLCHVKEGMSVRGGHQLGAAFAAAVRVKPAHRLVFTVAPDPLFVVVALVGGHVDNRPH